MSDSWQSVLERWRGAGLVDTAAAERIEAFEAARDDQPRLRWPVFIAIIFGALLLGSGVLLFVSSHWDELSPFARFSLVVILVTVFHVVGAVFSERFPAFALAMHGLGTAALGAGIFLAAQIFNLEEHWPGGIMLWALGAWIAWWLRRDWLQAGFAALLTPAWLASEWIDATNRYYQSDYLLAQGIFLLAITYMSALYGEHREGYRRVLVWIGGIALIPSAIAVVPWYHYGTPLPRHLVILGVVLGFGLPLLLAFFLRGKAVWANAVATGWTFLVLAISRGDSIFIYVWYAIACLGFIAWGLKELRRERINLGMLGFGLTVLSFYFSRVMDKLGRSASLIGLGLLFLGLAWALERTRRRLVARVKGATA